MRIVKPIPIFTLFLTCFLFFSCQLLLNNNPPDIDGVSNIHISLSEDGLERLYESVFYGDKVFCWYNDGDEIYPGKIKVRGDFSRQFNKKSFTVTVEKQNKIIKYAFIASYYDPSSIRNRLVFDTFRVMGFPVPETRGIALFINNHYLGYYTCINLYTEELLASFYPDSSIELYQCKFVNMGSDIPPQGLSEKKIPENDDFTSLNRLLVQASTLTDDEWNTWVSGNFDIDITASYLVLHNYLAFTDITQKNFNIILVDGKYFLLPWDNEACMRRNFLGYSLSSSSYNVNGKNMLTKRLLAGDCPVRLRYEELMNSLFLTDTTLQEQIRDMVTAYYTEIDTAVFYDHNRDTDYQSFLDEYNFLMLFLDERASEL